MKTIHNPHTEDLYVIHNHAKYVIKAGGDRAFTDDDLEAADKLLETFGFLEVKEETPVVSEDAGLSCQYGCGYKARSKAGLKAHERHCVAKDKPIKKKPRGQEEIDNFGNTDGVSSGTTKQEVIGKKKQNVTYDRDGVGWYGPGLEQDMVPKYIKKPGQF